MRDSVDELGLDTVEWAAPDAADGADEEDEDRGGDDQADDRVGEAEAEEDADSAGDNCK